VDININYFANFLKGTPQLVDLTRVAAPVRNKFIQSRFEIYSKDGKVYGLPTHVGATVVYYNKEIMDKPRPTSRASRPGTTSSPSARRSRLRRACR